MDIKTIKSPVARSAGMQIKYETKRSNDDVEKVSINWPDAPAPSLVKALDNLRMIVIDECLIPVRYGDVIHIVEIGFGESELGPMVKLKAEIVHTDLALADFKMDIEPLLIKRLPKEGEAIHLVRNEVAKYLKGHKLAIGMFDDAPKADKAEKPAKGKTTIGKPAGEPTTNGKAKPKKAEKPAKVKIPE